MPTALVTGATGQQGGATARALLRNGWHVRALVRDPAAEKARRLAEQGAQLVAGDMGDREPLTAAMRGADGVFSVQPAAGAPDFDPLEVRYGINVAEAAVAAGVPHLVYTSVAGADKGTGISHWETKWQIERHLATLPVPATILRPVMFMENHANRVYGVLGDFSVLRMIPPRGSVQLIAVTDIGEFAALAFADPAYYVGKALDLAGDELPRERLIAAVEGVTGRKLDLPPIPREELQRLGANLDDQERVKAFDGWSADIPALRALHPGLMTFDTWLEREGAAKFAALYASVGV